jgi:hypothetical protein
MVLGQIDMVHSTQGPVNSILCTGEILTVARSMSRGYIIVEFEGGGAAL